MKVSQSSRMISISNHTGEAKVEGKGKGKGGLKREEVRSRGGNNKFCPHHTSAERGLPLGSP
jgi:hypothetical protein